MGCSPECNRNTLNIISLHQPTSLPMTGAVTTKPHENNKPMQRHVRRLQRDHAGRDGYRENNKPTQRHVRRPQRDHTGRYGYRENNKPTERRVRKLRRDHTGREKYCKNNEPMERSVRRQRRYRWNNKRCDAGNASAPEV